MLGWICKYDNPICLGLSIIIQNMFYLRSVVFCVLNGIFVYLQINLIKQKNIMAI
jgi:hypothetical protein